MLKVSVRTKCEFLVVATLLLGSCGGHTPDEAYGLAERASGRAFEALKQCDDLDSRVSEIEGRLGL